MARILHKQAAPGGPGGQGCEVRGRVMGADGRPLRRVTIVVRPQAAQVRAPQNALHLAEAVRVQPDAEGAWAIRLLPGRYRVEINREVFVADVPETAAADFAAISQELMR